MAAQGNAKPYVSVPRVDWSNPLTDGLIGCYLPGTLQGIPIVGPKLSQGDGGPGSRVVLKEGYAYRSNTTGSNTGLITTAPAAYTGSAFSCYWRGRINGAPGDTFPSLIGVTYTNSDTNPFYGRMIAGDSSDYLAIGCRWNNAGTLASPTTAIDVTGSYGAQPFSLCGTFLTGGNSILYKNGVSAASDAFGAGAPSFSGPQLFINQYVPGTPRTVNADCSLALFWNRQLSASEVLQLDKNPYQFLIYPEEDMLVTLVGAAAVSVLEAEPHFIGKFTPVAHKVLPLLRSNIAEDFTQLPVQSEAQPHFIGKFTQPQYFINSRLRINAASDFSSGTTFETNTHFIGRFSEAQFNIWRGLRLNIAADFSSATPQVEANSHFLAKFSAPNYNVLTSLRQNYATDIPVTAVVETNTHFIGRFVPAQFTIPTSLRSNIAADFTTLPTQPETNTHFLGRFTQTQFAILPTLRSNIAADFSSQVQLETNINFIGRFTPDRFTIQSALRSNTAADFSSGVSFETNPHFVGRFTPVSFTIQAALRSNSVADFNQAETNPHFLGRYSPVAYNLYLGARQNQATDLFAVIVAETNVSFIGRFLPVQHSILPALRLNIAADFSTLQAQPETNVHFLGRFTSAIFATGFLYNTRPTDDGSSTPPAPPPGLHAPHFFSMMGMFVGSPANPPS